MLAHRHQADSFSSTESVRKRWGFLCTYILRTLLLSIQCMLTLTDPSYAWSKTRRSSKHVVYFAFSSMTKTTCGLRTATSDRFIGTFDLSMTHKIPCLMFYNVVQYNNLYTEIDFLFYLCRVIFLKWNYMVRNFGIVVLAIKCFTSRWSTKFVSIEKKHFCHYI